MKAPAKLNLFLHVQRERDDGYHPLQSLVAFAGSGDVLSVAPANKIDLIITGPFAKNLNADEKENIILRAARALQDWAAGHGKLVPGAVLTLTKNLPLASGIGGGSADAAAALRALAGLWDLDIDVGDLAELGLGLGADVPVCLYGNSAWMEGVGEQISPGPVLPPVHLVLVNPGCTVSTASVFSVFDARGTPTPPLAPGARPAMFSDLAALTGFLNTTRNDLEDVTCALVPEVTQALEALRGSGAVFARMSGSGATCFGLYENKAHAERAVNHLREIHPDWWVCETVLQDQARY